MTRMLIIEDDVPAAELTVHRLESAGLAFSWERVETEAEFRAALVRTPDIILSDSQVAGFAGIDALGIAKRACPATPFVFVSGNLDEAAVKRALSEGASAYVAKSDAAGLAATVRTALGQRGKAATEQRRLGPTAARASGIAEYLIERREVLDRTLQHHDRSAMSTIMRRTPPSPTALLMIDNPSARDRFAKLLRNANIEIDEAESVRTALDRLERDIHAVMFTDQLDLVRSSRQLHAGAATHVVFVGRGDQALNREALRAGANACMSDEPDSEEFWAHLTTVWRIVSLAASLHLALSDNRILSTVDELTGCGSRRFFEQEFPREVERATRLGRPLVLVMCDIDHFKKVNDGHGHQTGDEVLSEFGERLRHGLRLGQDWLARIGGEEFALVLPETSLEEGLGIAERLREQIRARPFRTRASAIRVTASFGVCACTRMKRKPAGIANLLIQAADGALYESKRSGRDRVTASGPI